MTKRFRNLPPVQAAVFEQIAVNNDKGHNPRTLDSLIVKGLIAVTQDRPPRYYVPTPIHIEWCQWCSENVREE